LTCDVQTSRLGVWFCIVSILITHTTRLNSKLACRVELSRIYNVLALVYKEPHLKWSGSHTHARTHTHTHTLYIYIYIYIFIYRHKAYIQRQTTIRMLIIITPIFDAQCDVLAE